MGVFTKETGYTRDYGIEAFPGCRLLEADLLNYPDILKCIDGHTWARDLRKKVQDDSGKEASTANAALSEGKEAENVEENPVPAKKAKTVSQEETATDQESHAE